MLIGHTSETIRHRFKSAKLRLAAAEAVRLDCYDGPATEVSELFSKFADGIFRIPDYARALANTPHVREIAFELNLETLE